MPSAKTTEAAVPTYQYACTACGHQLEAVQSFNDEPLTECPECQGKLRKLFSAVGIVFKGSGFYRTDSRSGSNSTSTSSSSSTSNGGAATKASSDTKSTDTKSTDSGKSDKAPATSSTAS
nr:FmdB family zinc ribbon protein [Planosporangium flavigriseum]